MPSETPIVDVRQLTPPKVLSAAEQEAWRDLVVDIGAHASTVSRIGLEAAACQLARLRWARERIEVEGEIVLDARDRPVPHPALAVERQAQAELRRWVEVLRGRSSVGRPAGATSAPDRRGVAPPVLELRDE